MAQNPITWDGKDAQGNPLRWDTPGLTWNGFLPQPTAKRMPQLRVLLSFAFGTDHLLEETAQAVHSKIYTNTAYPTPPVTAAALQAALDAFTAAIAAATLGGPEQTADRNNKREALIELLRMLAEYVQLNHGNDLAVLLSSGFSAASTNRASVPLERPSIKAILNDMSCQLVLRATTVKNARAYEVRYALIDASGTPGPWLDGGLFSKARSICIANLTAGALYQFQVRAIGGSTGHSDWSDTVQHRSL